MKFSKRHLAKTITWRIIGSLDTLLIAWLLSGDFSSGLQISGLELISKMLLYYIHERIWFKSSIENPSKRHLLKTFSWRAVGTIDTIMLSWMILGNPLIGIRIGGAETFTKLILYYLHEKVWYNLNFGLQKIRNKKIL